MDVFDKYKDYTLVPNFREDMVGVEQFCDFISNEVFDSTTMGAWITGRMPKFSAAMLNITKYLTTWDYSVPDELYPGVSRGALKGRDFSVLRDEIIYTPVGIKGNLYDYARWMHDIGTPVLKSIVNDVLVAAKLRFGHYLNNTIERTDRKDFQFGSKFGPEVIDKLLKENAKFTYTGSHVSTREFGDCFGNVNQFVDTAQLLNDMSAMINASAPPKLVTKAVEDLSFVSNALFESLTSDDSKTNPEFIKMLSEEIRTIARWVEYYTVAYTRLVDFTSAMKQNENNFLNN